MQQDSDTVVSSTSSLSADSDCSSASGTSTGSSDDKKGKQQECEMFSMASLVSSYCEEEICAPDDDEATDIAPKADEAVIGANIEFEDITRNLTAGTNTSESRVDAAGTGECTELTRFDDDTGNHQPKEMSLWLDRWYTSIIEMATTAVYDAVLTDCAGGGGQEQVMTEVLQYCVKTTTVLERRADRTATSLMDTMIDATTAELCTNEVNIDLLVEDVTRRSSKAPRKNSNKVDSRRRASVGKTSLSRDTTPKVRSGSEKHRRTPVTMNQGTCAQSITSRDCGIAEARDGPPDASLRSLVPKPLVPVHQQIPVGVDEATESVAKQRWKPFRKNLRFWTRDKMKSRTTLSSETYSV